MFEFKNYIINHSLDNNILNINIHDVQTNVLYEVCIFDETLNNKIKVNKFKLILDKSFSSNFLNYTFELNKCLINDNITLIVNVELDDVQIISENITLENKKIDKYYSKYLELSQENNKIMKDIVFLKNEIDNIKEKNNKLEEKIIILEEKNNELEEKIIILEEKNNEFNNTELKKIYVYKKNIYINGNVYCLSNYFTCETINELYQDGNLIVSINYLIDNNLDIILCEFFFLIFIQDEDLNKRLNNTLISKCTKNKINKIYQDNDKQQLLLKINKYFKIFNSKHSPLIYTQEHIKFYNDVINKL